LNKYKHTGAGLIALGLPGKRQLPIAVLTLVLAACGGNVNEGPKERTLADLKPVAPPVVSDELPRVSRSQLIDSYRELLLLTEDSELQRGAMKRLGSLLMLESEERQVNEAGQAGSEQQAYYAEAIKLYRKLLQEYPLEDDNDSVYYNLSKAYDLQTQQSESADALDRLVRKHPESAFAAEAFFRRGEMHFAAQRYRQAQLAYEKVISFGETPFYDNSLYMRGWSQFKRNQYEDAMRSFVFVLDRVYPDTFNIDTLTKQRRELLDDVLRVISLSFSHVEGPQSIRDLVKDVGSMHFEHLLYEGLAELYLSKKRYRDAADAYGAYVEVYPLDQRSPGFSVKQIDIFAQGNFPTLVLPAKKAYVERYGVTSYYWSAKTETDRNDLKPTLHKYLDELATTAHADAQLMSKALAKAGKDKRKLKKLGFAAEDVRKEYLAAERWYNEFITTFPADEKTPKVWFLLAEVQYEAGRFAEAVETYEQIAYGMPDHPKGAEAGYAALLAYEQIPAAIDPDEAALQQDRRLDSAIEFSTRYAADKRAPQVLLKASEELLQQQNYLRAQTEAQRLVDWATPINKAQRTGALLVLAHSQFELKDFAAAESAYQTLQGELPAGDKRAAGIEENLAASIYQQGSLLVDQGDLDGAVGQFLRVAKAAPNSAIVKSAEFDAATHLLTLERWPEAISVMEAFRLRYPDDELAAQLPAKLALAYQEDQQWAKAGAELRNMAANDDDPESARTATYLAAELYEKAGDQAAAVDAYSAYVEKYPQPVGQSIEAAERLVQLEGERQRYKSRVKWMREVIRLDAEAGDARSDRTRYLAAKSSLVFADFARDRFDKIKLTLPLKKSLGKKKKALQASLDSYRKVSDYEVQEFATQATYRIAEIYAGLSRDLMNSQRPPNLSELELEQYDILLEEQAYPFEEEAIAIHEINAQRSWAGIYDDWVANSLAALRKLLPGRYAKDEQVKGYSDAIF
jgi:TolA-binding protein